MNELNISDDAILPIIGGLMIIFFAIFIIYYFFMAICLMKIAKKTETENAWFAWIPILDMLLAIQIAKKPTWWIVWFFIPLANILAYIMVWMGISKTLGKPEWLGILMIISPINLIVPGYLAFSATAVLQKPEVQVVNVSL